MPVMVVGADTEPGQRIIHRFLDNEREVRAFVSDPDVADELRRRGAKVALGDVSDDSHLAGACLNCFSVVLVGDAATDGRERSFASRPDGVLAAWARAVESAAVTRVIWVGDVDTPEVAIAEVASVRPDEPDLAEAVFGLDAQRRI